MKMMNAHTIEIDHSCVGRQRGVTLVEMMVGLFVGMLAVLIISQVLLTSEGQKRTTTGGADAQVNGALALYALQRDIEHAGYGIASSPAILNCPISVRHNGAVPAGFPTRLDPVVITPGGSGTSGDSIRVLGSSTSAVAIPTRVVPPNYVAGSTVFNVRSTVGFAQGHLALVAIDETQPCSIFQISAAPTATSLSRTDNSTWNAAGTPATTYVDGAVMINLGTVVDNVYQISNNTLQVSSFNLATPAVRVTRELQPDIVLMRAFYGRDTSTGASTDGIVDVFDTTTPSGAADWQKVLSVRLITVARSSNYEKEQVTTSNPRWSVGVTPGTAGAVTCAAGSCLELDVGAGAAGDVPAKHYRYKVFETVIPLRNLLWRSA